MRSWAARKALSLRALPEGGPWGVRCSCRSFSPSRKGEPRTGGSLLKKWLRWRLSIVLSRLLDEAAWLIWPDFACEQGLRAADCSLRRWPGHALHKLVRGGSHPTRRQRLIPFLLNLGWLGTALTGRIWWKWCPAQTSEPQIWEQNKMVVVLHD